MLVYQNSFRRKNSKICIISITILLFFLIKVLSLPCDPEYFGVSFCDKTIKYISTWFNLARRTQNLEFVNFKHVTYTQPIWVALRTHIELSGSILAADTTDTCILQASTFKMPAVLQKALPTIF